MQIASLARPRTSNPGHAPSGGTTPRRVGGHPALDFLNTVDPDLAVPDCLPDYARFLAWSADAGLVSGAERTALARAARADPPAAEAVFRQAIALREALRRIVAARVAGRRAAEADVASLNALLRSLGQPGLLVSNGLGFVRAQGGAGPALGEPLRRLLELSAAFLVSSDFAQTRACEAGCGWFFVDRSPSKRRRWCSMEGCGNRVKAQRHYQRTARPRPPPARARS